MRTTSDRNIIPGAALSAASLAAALSGLLLAGCASDLPRDPNGSPYTSRLAPHAVPPPPVTPEQKQQLTALNAQILRDQEATIAQQQQAQAWANAYYAYPAANWNLYYGGWGGGWGGGSRWGAGVSVGSPGYYGGWGGWGGYPYGWW